MAKQNNTPGWIIFLIGIYVGASILLVIFGSLGYLNTPSQRLGIDKEELGKQHILEYYPEYDKCNFNLDSSNSKECFNIYCETVLDKDGLRVDRKTEPKRVICFNDFSIEELFLRKIKEEFPTN